ncbi:TonB-dependent receptor plug domain-containing protein [Oceanicoccus sp. KOV_DT_Chl]|uniref:TonB-dependent receptor plug domain-containing protein n=1 Tax=Oceanicoccus sp. KOV_DT_Chl TaxID=1904639 RepID=UPI001359D125|nr:TonB-dependent receptor plug domain-containing protein [Oceanicoccus sp. KOV_DT_Chl]
MRVINKKSLASAIQYALGTMTLSAMISGSANAESDRELYIEEVITTATTQSTLLSDTGISISSIDSMTMDEMGVNNFKDFTRTIPGVNFTEGNAPGEQTIIIRGVNFPSNRFQQSTVAVYIDELSLTQNGRNPDIDLIDMERVEVLRGPQGTLYGSSSMGGTLRYISNKPDTEEFTGDVEFGVEQTGSGDMGYRVNSTVNIPLTDTIAIRASAYMKDLDGWIDSVGWAGSSSGSSNEIIDGSLAEKNINSEETTGGRVALRWSATEDLTVDLMYLNHDTEVDGLSNENPYWGEGKQQRRFKETYADKLETYNLALNYDVEEGTFLWNSSKMVRDYKRVSDPSRQRIGLAWWYGDFSDAFDYSLDAFTDADGDFAGHAVRDRPIDFDLETHEFRFSSSFEGAMNFVAGAYFSKANNRWKQTETYPGITESKGTLVPFAYPNFYLGTSYEDAATTADFIVEADGYSGQDTDSDGVVDIFQFEPVLYANAPLNKVILKIVKSRLNKRLSMAILSMS